MFVGQSSLAAIRPLQPADYGALRSLEISSRAFAAWRPAELSNSPSEYLSGLWEGVFAQFLVFRVRDDVPDESSPPIALIAAYNFDPSGQTLCVGVCRFLSGSYESSRIESGILLSLEELYQLQPIRKVYFECGPQEKELLERQFGDRLEQEVILPFGRFVRGEYQDLFVLALSRRPDERAGEDGRYRDAELGSR